MRVENHTKGQNRGHSKYDELISMAIDRIADNHNLESQAAFDELMMIISNTRGKISNDIFGSMPIKFLDDITGI